MPYENNHPVWKILLLLVVGLLGLGFCHIAYSNGVDLLKDGTLVAAMVTAGAAVIKFLPGE